MRYAHILSAFAAEPLAIQREKIGAITSFLIFKAEGGKFSSDERAARITKKRETEVSKSPGGVGIIPVYGVLAQRMDMFSEISGGTSYQALRQMVHEAIANDDIKAIILDFDSPGGTVPGTEELAAELRALRGGDKPIIAQVNALAASAAYWIASATDEIVVTPSGRAGSIGVYTSHDDISEFLAQKGIKRTYLAAGKHKVDGNEAEPLGEDARAHIMELVEQSYQKFVAAVADGRGVSKSRVEETYGQGRLFGAEALLDRGMVDRIATLEQTLARFGVNAEPDVVRRVKAANAAKAEAGVALASKLRNGERIQKREFENGLKGLAGLSNSEAERAARLYFKDGQGEPDIEADKAALAALERVLAQAKAF